MIRALIDISIRNRFMVLIATLLISFAGWQAMKSTPLDAIPDLSDVQVIISPAFPARRRRWWKTR